MIRYRKNFSGTEERTMQLTFFIWYMLWKTQPDDELEDKGHDENHSQSKHSIFNHIFSNIRHYQVLLQIHYEQLANPLDISFTTNSVRRLGVKLVPSSVNMLPTVLLY